MPISVLESFKAHTALALEGHVFDSLTLNKLLDTILAHEGHFLITNVRIGISKTEPSSVHITVFGKDDPHLKTILEALAPLHPKTLSGTSSLVAVAVDGLLPASAAVLGYMPVSVSIEGTGELAAGGALGNALVLKKEGATLVPVLQSSLKAGDHVVAGADGFVWQQA
jgi:hypothetical protein